MSLWYEHGMWRDRLCQRKSISVRLSIRCHALHWSPYQKRDPLSNDHRDKMCLYSTSSAPMKLFPQSSPTWTMSKGFIKLTDSPLTAKWIVSQIAACLNKMTASSARGRSADLILNNFMGLSVLGGVCVCTHTHFWVSVLCATVRLNPQLSLTGLAEWTAEVYHCLLISTDSHQPIRAGHSVGGPSGNQCCGPGLTYSIVANVSECLRSRHPSFRVRKSQISQSYQGQQMLLSLSSLVKNAVWLHLKWNTRESI